MNNTRFLIIMRHAEAKDGLPHEDKARLLTRYGHSQAQSCGRELRAAGYIPEVIIRSDAKRIEQTSEELQTQWGAPPQVIVDSRLYTPLQGLTDDNLLHFYSRVADQADNAATTLMILGHNPTIAHVAGLLSRGMPDQLATGYPSATACVFSSSAQTWYEVSPANSRLDLIVHGGEKVFGPRHLHRVNRPEGHPSPEAK